MLAPAHCYPYLPFHEVYEFNEITFTEGYAAGKSFYSPSAHNLAVASFKDGGRSADS